jgi:hypothetical protein
LTKIKNGGGGGGGCAQRHIGCVPNLLKSADQFKQLVQACHEKIFKCHCIICALRTCHLVRETMLWLAVYAMLTRKAPARQSLRHGQTVWALGASQPIGMPKPYGRY